MKHIFFLLFLPFWAFSRSLQPGVYKDLKPDKPIVLGHGEYTFINLEMVKLGKGVWLDARKAKNLTLIGCRFESEGMKGTGVLAAQQLTVQVCTFSRLEKGIKVVAKKTKVEIAQLNQLIIIGNTFTNNLTSVYLDNGFHSLDLKCNVFNAEELSFSLDRKGVVIGAEASLFQSRIGGNNSPNALGDPNSNYFPRTIGVNNVIQPFPGYYSVWNESENPIDYYKYENEDLGSLFPSFGSNSVNELPQFQITVTRQNLENWCNEMPPTATQPNWQSNGQVAFNNLTDCREMEEIELLALKSFQLIPNNWVLACDGGPLDFVSFPIPRPIGANLVSEIAESLSKDKVYLGQSIPNPARARVTIPVLLSELKGKAILEIFDLGSGRILAQKAITTLGQHMLDFEVQNWAAGMYGYRLLLTEGKAPSPKKMVLLK